MTKLKNNNKAKAKSTKATKTSKSKLSAVQKKIKQLTGKTTAKATKATAKVKAKKTAPVKAVKKNNTKVKSSEAVKTVTLELNSDCNKSLNNVVHTFGSFIEKQTGGAVKRDSRFEVFFLIWMIENRQKSEQPLVFQRQFEYVNKVSASHCFTDKSSKAKKESLIDVKTVGERITKNNGINERAGNDYMAAFLLNSKKASEFARVAYKIKTGQINLDSMVKAFHSAEFAGQLGKRKTKVIMIKE